MSQEQSVIDIQSTDEAHEHKAPHYIALAVSHYRLKEYKEAEECYKKAIEIDAHNALSYAELGFFYYTQNRHVEAIAIFTQALHYDTTNAQYYDGLGSACYELGEYANAIVAFTQALHYAPENASYHSALGDSYAKLGEFANAIVAFTQALHYAPENASYHSALGGAYAKLGEFANAIVAFTQALHYAPENASYHSALGGAYYALDNYADAIVAFTQAARYAPENASYHSALGDACYALDNYADAIAAFRQAVRYDPENVLYLGNLGFTYYESGDYRHAIECYKQAVRYNPKIVQYHDSLGSAYAKLGEFSHAIDCHKEAIRRDPENAQYHDSLGFTYYESGDYRRAVECYKQAVSYNPKNGQYHDDLATANQALRESEVKSKQKKSNITVTELKQKLKLKASTQSKEVVKKLEVVEEGVEIVKKLTPSQLKKQKQKMKQLESAEKSADVVEESVVVTKVPTKVQMERAAKEVVDRASVELIKKIDAAMDAAKVLLRAKSKVTGEWSEEQKWAAVELVGKLQAFVSTASQNDTIHEVLGDIFFNILDNSEAAKEAYKAAINLKPNKSSHHNNLGIILEDLGQYAEAAEAFRASIEISLSLKNGTINPTYYRNYAQILYKVSEEVNHTSLEFLILSLVSYHQMLNTPSTLPPEAKQALKTKTQQSMSEIEEKISRCNERICHVKFPIGTILDETASARLKTALVGNSKLLELTLEASMAQHLATAILTNNVHIEHVVVIDGVLGYRTESATNIQKNKKVLDGLFSTEQYNGSVAERSMRCVEALQEWFNNNTQHTDSLDMILINCGIPRPDTKIVLKDFNQVFCKIIMAKCAILQRDEGEDSVALLLAQIRKAAEEQIEVEIDITQLDSYDSKPNEAMRLDLRHNIKQCPDLEDFLMECGGNMQIHKWIMQSYDGYDSITPPSEWMNNLKEQLVFAYFFSGKNGAAEHAVRKGILQNHKYGFDISKHLNALLNHRKQNIIQNGVELLFAECMEYLDVKSIETIEISLAHRGQYLSKVLLALNPSIINKFPMGLKFCSAIIKATSDIELLSLVNREPTQQNAVYLCVLEKLSTSESLSNAESVIINQRLLALALQKNTDESMILKAYSQLIDKIALLSAKKEVCSTNLQEVCKELELHCMSLQSKHRKAVLKLLTTAQKHGYKIEDQGIQCEVEEIAIAQEATPQVARMSDNSSPESGSASVTPPPKHDRVMKFEEVRKVIVPEWTIGGRKYTLADNIYPINLPHCYSATTIDLSADPRTSTHLSTWKNAICHMTQGQQGYNGIKLLKGSRCYEVKADGDMRLLCNKEFKGPHKETLFIFDTLANHTETDAWSRSHTASQYENNTYPDKLDTLQCIGAIADLA